jgi:DNA mismatch endonuclease, patch repair protein
MGRVRGKDTRPEMAVRRLVHGLGFRYRLHARDLPGTPDLVFRSRRKVVFVHGCFWHRHSECKLARLPKTRLDFWRTKLDANRDRDLRSQAKLIEAGWRLLVIWECEVADWVSLAERVTAFIEEG